MNFSKILEKIDIGISKGHIVAFSPKQDINNSSSPDTIPPKLFRIIRFSEWNKKEYIQFREPGKELDLKFFSKNYGVDIKKLDSLDTQQQISKEGKINLDMNISIFQTH
jgi:hypothetical protein